MSAVDLPQRHDRIPIAPFADDLRRAPVAIQKQAHRHGQFNGLNVASPSLRPPLENHADVIAVEQIVAHPLDPEKRRVTSGHRYSPLYFLKPENLALAEIPFAEISPANDSKRGV